MTTKSDDLRVGEACAWFVRHNSPTELSADEVREWEEWIADDDNRVEYAEVAGLPRLLRTLPRPPLPSGAELRAHSFDILDGEPPELDSAEPVVLDSAIVHALPRRGRPSLMVGVAVACCLAGILCWQAGLRPSLLSGQAGKYTTEAGQQRRVQLKDGSNVLLAAGTELLADQPRLVTLVKGEALFNVKSDPKNPFRVRAEGRTITALGTEFDIRRYSKRVQVAVTEGAVEVAPEDALRDPSPSAVPGMTHPRDSAQPGSVRVEKGQETSYDFHGYIKPPQRSDPDQAIGWTRGLFTYEGKPLEEVVEDVRRYYPKRIEIDPSVARLQYSGTVRQLTIEEWAKNLPQIFPVVVELTPGAVIIRSRE